MRLHSFDKVFLYETYLNDNKNPQANALMERFHQVILNMIVQKDLDNKVFDYIYPQGETLAYIAWEIRASYHRNIRATAGQAVLEET